MQGEILVQGVELMLFGMGTVVVFLGLLVVATAGMSWLVERFFPQPQPAAHGRRRGVPAPAATADKDTQLVAVISAAVHRHRQRHGK